MDDDRQLLARYALEDSEEAFAEFVKRNTDFVYGVALRCLNGDQAASEDVVQTVFCAVARKAAQLATHPALSAWLYTSTRFAARDLIRGEQRRRLREMEAVMRDAEKGEPVPEWSTLAPLIDRALEELGDKEREAVLQRFFKGKTHGEIAATLGLSEEAARKRLERAMDRLRLSLARLGLVSTAGALSVALTQAPLHAAPQSLALQASTTALASLGGSTTSGTLLLTVMNTMNTKIAVTAALLFVGCGLVGSAWMINEGVNLRAQKAAPRAPVLAKDSDAKREAGQAGVANKQVDFALAEAEAMRPSKGGSLLDDPRFQTFRKLQFQLEVQRDFRDFFKTAQLPADKETAAREKLVALLDKRDRFRELQKAGAPNAEAAAKLRAEGKALELEVNQTLGPEYAESFKNYAQNVDVGKTGAAAVREIAMDFEDSGAALDEAQRKSLAQLMGARYAVKRSDPDAWKDKQEQPGAEGLSVREYELANKAASFLSSSQAELLRRKFRLDKAQRDFYAKARKEADSLQ